MLFFLYFKEIDYAMVVGQKMTLPPEKAGIPEPCYYISKVYSFDLCSFYVLREKQQDVRHC